LAIPRLSLAGKFPMDGIENARHDLSEAACSVDTAIELLSSMEQDGFEHADVLHPIIEQLQKLKSGLEDSYQSLIPLSPDAET
jgi:hypothetical protein